MTIYYLKNHEEMNEYEWISDISLDTYVIEIVKWQIYDTNFQSSLLFLQLKKNINNIPHSDFFSL